MMKISDVAYFYFDGESHLDRAVTPPDRLPFVIRFRLRCTPSEDGLPSDRLPPLLLRAPVLSAPARAPVSSAPRLSTTCFFIEHFSQLYVTMYPVTMLSDDDVRGYVT